MNRRPAHARPVVWTARGRRWISRLTLLVALLYGGIVVYVAALLLDVLVAAAILPVLP